MWYYFFCFLSVREIIYYRIINLIILFIILFSGDLLSVYFMLVNRFGFGFFKGKELEVIEYFFLEVLILER